MEALVLKMANLSIAASWLVLAVLILRLALRKAPGWITCTLWGLVALRLVFPFSIESAWSLIPSAETIPPEILSTETPQIQSGIGAVDDFVNPHLADSLTPTLEASVNPSQVWSFLLTRIWVAGTALLLLYALASWLLVRRRVATAVPLSGNIRQSEQVDSPFVFGLLRPTIYLPFQIADEDLGFVVAHEQAHIRRGDPWWKLIGFALLAVYWTNPLLWVAYVLFCRDLEAACDEKVIRAMGKEERQGYSKALLRFSAMPKRKAPCPLSFGETNVKERIRRIMDYKKPARWVVLLAVVAVVAVAVFLLTSPVSTSSGAGTYRLTFPSSEEGRTEYNAQIYDIDPFELQFALPDGWSANDILSDSGVADESPSSYFGMAGLMFNCIGLYDEEGRLVGTVGYNTFEWAENGDPRAIYAQIALGNNYQFDVRDSYTVVSETEHGKTALADVLYSPVINNGEEKTNWGILSYDQERLAYVAFELDSGLVSAEQTDAIARSIRLADPA